MSKIRWTYHWRDGGTDQHGPATRARVAYLLRAARSTRTPIARRPYGYRIGRLALIAGRLLPSFPR